MKLHEVLEQHPQDVIFTSKYLKQRGISSTLCQRYQQSGHLKSLGYGAWCLADQEPTLFHALSCLQQQEQKPIHIGGLTALILHRQTHYVYPDITNPWYLMPTATHLPFWFEKHLWGVWPQKHRTNFLPYDIGLISWEPKKQPKVIISSIERATLECLHGAPRKISLAECYQNLECLCFDDSIHIDLMQTLLEQCQSHKVKKLFLSFAEHNEVEWFDDLNLSNISLGQGIHVASPFEGGQLCQKYKVMIPQSVLALDDYQQAYQMN